MNDKKKEIRQLLIGSYLEGENGLEAFNNFFNPFSGGSRRGTLSSYLLGVSAVKRTVTYRGKEEKITAAFADAFAHVGRRAHLSTVPDALCVLVMPIFFRPYVFTFETGADKEGLLLFYSARGVLTRLNGKFRIRRLMRNIDDSLLVTEEAPKRSARKKKAASAEKAKKD